MENQSMGDLLAQYGSTERLYTGDVVEGVVISSNSDEVMVNINYMADGIMPKSELLENNPLDFHEGDQVKVFILKLDDGDGNVLLSLKKAYELIIWDEFQTLYDTHKTFDVKVKEAVKGGVVAYFKGFPVFIPASQLSLAFVEDLTPYVGMTLEIELTEYNADKKKVVGSHKNLLKNKMAVKKADALSRLSSGDQLEGTVVRMADYGAFVNIGDMDGLIHISQMSWKHIKHPSEVLSVGDVVKVTVISVDRDKEKVSLKLSEIKENPWETLSDRYAIDDIVTGKVTRLMNFGAFVEIEDGVEGLVHISELAEQHVNRPQEIVQVGDAIEVMILDMNPESQKLSLSLKAVGALGEVTYDNYTEETPNTQTTMSDLFGDKLKNLKF